MYLQGENQMPQRPAAIPQRLLWKVETWHDCTIRPLKLHSLSENQITN